MFRKWLPQVLCLLLFAGCREQDVLTVPALAGVNAEYFLEKNDLLIVQNQGCSAVFKHDSCRCEIKGIPVIMPDAASKKTAGSWVLPERSIDLVIKPLLFYSGKIPARRIVIDAGHGGKDNGTVGSISSKLEKDLNLSMALLIGEELKQHGFTVLYTRKDDRFIALDKRANMYPDADIFISIHHNWAKRQAAAGFESFCLLPGENILNRHAESVQLAYAIQQQQSSASGNYGRGVKFAGFRVLRDAKCPAVLLEIGFLSNPDEEKRCISPSFQQVMAKAVVSGIRKTVSLSNY